MSFDGIDDDNDKWGNVVMMFQGRGASPGVICAAASVLRHKAAHTPRTPSAAQRACALQPLLLGRRCC
eukprot:1158358-Pelagomonas_calceolata.AAC.9